MLTDKIRINGPETNEPEDFFGSSLGVIFPDDITNQHGDKENSLLYLSPTHSSIPLTLADPKTATTLSLFSHFLWNASLQLAEFIEESPEFSVSGRKILELGAGTGLSGIIAALEGAKEVVISDYPAEEVLENLRVNVRVNIDRRKEKESEREREVGGEKTEEGKTVGEVKVVGHEWGVLTDPFSLENKESFDILLVADCLWMPWQHINLLHSIRHFLTSSGRAWVVAGFHTGREKMRGFYAKAALEEAGLEIEKIWERNAEGVDREWVEDRGIEDVTERKRWLVIGVLKRKEL